MNFEYFNNYFKITNYRQLKQLNDDLIIVDNLHITGSDLHIIKINVDYIVINGVITNIKLGD